MSLWVAYGLLVVVVAFLSWDIDRRLAATQETLCATSGVVFAVSGADAVAAIAGSDAGSEEERARAVREVVTLEGIYGDRCEDFIARVADEAGG